jgi:hypothetical protein
MRKFLLYAALVFTLVSTVSAQYVPTPNIGLEIPANGSNNWNIPLNYNFNRLDQLLSGQLSLPGLSVSGNVTVTGSVTANSFIGAGGAGLATASIASQWSPVYYSASPTGNSFAGVSPFTGLAKYSATGPPSSAVLSDINSLLLTGSNCSTTGTVYSPKSGSCVVAGGVAAGSTQDVQFNTNGAFAADTNFFGYTLGSHTLSTTNQVNSTLFSSKSTNDILNSDMFLTSPTSNDGVPNAFASSYCSPGPCLVTRNTNSADNYDVGTAFPPSGDTLVDHQLGRETYIIHNPPAISAPHTNSPYDCNGFNAATCHTVLFDTVDPTATVQPTSRPGVESASAAFNMWSWNYGNCPNCGNTQWGPAGSMESLYAGFSSQGITQVRTSDVVKHGTGDWSSFYAYFFSDGGQPDYSGEGGNNETIQGGETSDYGHFIVGSGGTANTISLPIVYNSAFTPSSINRNATSGGGYMIDITQGSITGHVTGVDQTLPQNAYVGILPIDTSVTPSTAYGNTTCEMPVPVSTNPNLYGSITCTISNIGGSNSAGFTTGFAELSGDFPEGVTITSAPTPASGGSQTVTFTYVHPHGSTQTMLWQGSNVIGDFLSWDYYTGLNSMKSPFHVYGATDSTHIVAQPRFGGVVINPYNAGVVQTVSSLTQSGTTVTALIYPSTSISAMQPFNKQSAVISGCSDAGFNQTVTNVTLHPAASPNQTVTWTSPGTGSTCATASITLVPATFAFHLYPGAEQFGPAIAAPANLPLLINNVNWTPGDLIEMPHHFDWSGTDLRTTWIVNNATAVFGGNSNGAGHTFQGPGIGGQFKPFNVGIANPCSYYVGCGGNIPPVYMVIFGTGGNPSNGGVNGGGIRLGEAPINGGAGLSIGCADAALGGCSSIDPIIFLQTNENAQGIFEFLPGLSSWALPSLTVGLPSPNSRPGLGTITAGSYHIAGFEDNTLGLNFYGYGSTVLNTLGFCNHNSFTFAISVGTCTNGSRLSTSVGELDAGVLRADASASLASISVGLVPPVKAPTLVYTGTTGTTERNYGVSVVSPLGVEGALGESTYVENTASTLDASDYVTITCPTSLQPNYPTGTTYNVWSSTGTPYPLGNCPVGGSIVDNGTHSAGTYPTQFANMTALALQWQVELGGALGFWNSNTTGKALDVYINRLSANTIGIGSTPGTSHNGSFEAATITADTGFAGSGSALTNINAVKVNGGSLPTSTPYLATNGTGQVIASTNIPVRYVGTITSVAGTSDTLSVTGLTTSNHCSIQFTNSGSAALTGDFVSVGTGSLTWNHSLSVGGETVDAFCNIP